MATKKTEPGKKLVGKCAGCGKACGRDAYCYGCHEFVCEDCSVNYDPPWGKHDVGVHFDDPEDGGDGY